MRKKTQALTIIEKPTARAAYSKLAAEIVMVDLAGELGKTTVEGDRCVKATWQPARAKKRKKVVPRNSPMKLMSAW
jgi:hypothetical protein